MVPRTQDICTIPNTAIQPLGTYLTSTKILYTARAPHPEGEGCLTFTILTAGKEIAGNYLQKRAITYSRGSKCKHRHLLS